MVEQSTGPARVLPDTPRADLERWASARLTYLDNLKVVLITAIIAMHAVLGYAGTVEVWTYTGLREVTLNPVVEAALLVFLSPFGFVLMTLLFLVAGLLTPSSFERKGAGRFVRDRLLRLGVPFAAYVFVVQPVLVYALEHPLGDAPGSFWAEYLGAEHQVDTGPLWFVGVLLIYSLAYAGWRRWSDGAGGRHAAVARATSPVTLRRLVTLAGMVAPLSFLVRLVYPYGSESGFSDLNLWQWPGCLAAFALGVVTTRQGWLEEIPHGLAHRSRSFTLVGLVAMATLLGAVGALDTVDDALGGWHWPAAVFVVVEAVLTVFGSVWLLSVAQRLLHRHHRWGPALSRSAYAAFMLQTVFLLALALALRPLDAPAEVKALLVAAGGVATSFGAAWLLVTKVPGVARVL
ncbi:acyltransferase family protein [Nocardioides pakistanensis]